MKTIILTGCSSGIGRFCAEMLKNTGQYRVIATCRKQQDCDELLQLGIESLQLDLENPESVNTAAEQLLTLTDHRIDALFNNAGYGVYGPLESISRDELQQQFSCNFFGVHQLTMKLLPALLAAGDARIIQTSSVLGLISTPHRGAYAASKYALEAWSDALRMELAQHSAVKVILIEPGPIETHFTRNVQQCAAHKTVGNSPFIQKFALKPDAVFKKFHHALTHPSPKIRYRVTLVTQVVAILKRLLPDRLMDRILTQGER